MDCKNVMQDELVFVREVWIDGVEDGEIGGERCWGLFERGNWGM